MFGRSRAFGGAAMNSAVTLAAEADTLIPLAEVLQAVVGGTVLVGGLGILLLAVSFGKARWVRRSAAALERRTGLPGWCALPLAIMVPALLLGLLGMMWDVAWHVEKGRDNGLISQPSHVMSLLGLYGAFAGAALSLVIPTKSPGRGAVRLAPTIIAPVGGVVATVGFGASLLAFPFDDAWHRVFGLDVALWSPVHFVLLTSAVVGVLGIMLLVFDAEGAAQPDKLPPAEAAGWAWVLRLFLCGALVAVPAILLDEWNVGIPQADLLYDPLVLALSTAGLVMARTLLGKWGPIQAWAVSAVLGGASALFVGPVLGNVTPRLSLLLGFAVAVQVCGMVISPRKPWLLALVAGPTAGLLGGMSEYAWSHAMRPLPWPSHLLPQALAITVLVSTAAAMAGTFTAQLLLRRSETLTARPVAGFVAAFVVILAAVGVLVGPSTLQGTAHITTTATGDGPDRPVLVQVRFDPPLPQHTKWVYVLAWQGGGVTSVPLTQGRDGIWRTSEPVPTTGKWKTAIRIAAGDARTAVPVRFPTDPELGFAEIPLEAHTSRSLVSDVSLMQRERRTDTPAWLYTAGTVLCSTIGAALLATFLWGLARPTRDTGTRRPTVGSRHRVTAAPPAR